MKVLRVLLMLLLALGWGMGYGQIKVVNGNVGIGTTNPGRILHISTLGKGIGSVCRNEADANFDAKYEFWEDGVEYWEFGLKGNTTGNPFRIGPNTSALTKVEVRSNGNVGIGIINPSNKLAVAGNALKTSGGNTWLIPSDIRLKQNISDFKDGLNVILKMHPIKYNYNGKAGLDNSEVQIGLLAQDLQSIAPYLVSEFTYEYVKEATLEEEYQVLNTEKYLKVKDSQIKYILINAIKEQQVLIEAKNDEIDDLKIRLAKLENYILKLPKQ